jgi:DnaJ-class molecular chaperone
MTTKPINTPARFGESMAVEPRDECPTCGGAGELEDDHMPYTCGVCRGTGLQGRPSSAECNVLLARWQDAKDRCGSGEQAMEGL